MTLSDDITGIKMLEQDRELILDLSNDLFAVVGDDGAIRALNHDSWRRIFGQVPGSLGPQHFERFIAEDDRAGAQSRFDQLVQTEQGFAEFEARSDIAGSTRWFSWSCRKAGSRPLVYVTLRDITSRIEMEQDLRQARDRARMAVAARSRFLANMSHEIRTPLNAVISMVDLAMLTDCSPKQIDYLITAKESSHHLLAVLNDMLDLVRIDQGRYESGAERFSLRVLCESISSLLRFSIEQKGLRFNFDFEGPDPVLCDDAGSLGRILNNLLGNAIKFTEHGEISFSVKLAAEDDHYRAGFEIRDTGIGIAEDKLDIIFDRFAQADESLTRKYGGTGLGLAISQQLVQIMGGTIELASRQGQGSTFSFSVALKPDAGSVPEPAADKPVCSVPPGSAPGLAILLAEDNIINNRIATMVLCKMGHTVFSAENGRCALEMFDQQHIDLILMDLEMPEMDALRRQSGSARQAGAAGEQCR